MSKVYDSLQYVRDYYNVPAYKGVRVNVYGKSGVITGGDGSYVKIRLDGAKHAGNYHPTDGVTYLIEANAATEVD